MAGRAAAKAGVTKFEVLAPVSNDAKEQIEFQNPYIASVEVEGTCPIIFHRWSIESVEEKSKAAKGSRAKKTDDVESYVYRDEEGYVCIPTEYFRQAIIQTARFKQDPRSPRKSAKDLMKAAIACDTELNRIEDTGRVESKEWDYLFRCRVVIHGSAITRSRPAFKLGWKARFRLQILLPEYVSPQFLNELIALAGKINGVADQRPSYGRFQTTSFQTSEV